MELSIYRFYTDFFQKAWRMHWHPTPVLVPGKSHGWRSLVGCGPWGCQESDLTEQLHFHFSLSCIGECLVFLYSLDARTSLVPKLSQNQTNISRYFQRAPRVKSEPIWEPQCSVQKSPQLNTLHKKHKNHVMRPHRSDTDDSVCHLPVSKELKTWPFIDQTNEVLMYHGSNRTKMHCEWQDLSLINLT